MLIGFVYCVVTGHRFCCINFVSFNRFKIPDVAKRERLCRFKKNKRTKIAHHFDIMAIEIDTFIAFGDNLSNYKSFGESIFEKDLEAGEPVGK